MQEYGYLSVMHEFSFVNGNVPFMEECAIFGGMYHLWRNVPFLVEYAIFGEICQFWRNVPILEKCAIYGEECAIYGEECAILGGNVLSDAISKNIAFLPKNLFWLHLVCNTLDLLFICILSYSFYSFQDKHQHVSYWPIAWCFWYHLYTSAMPETSESCQGCSFRRNLQSYYSQSFFDSYTAKTISSYWHVSVWRRWQSQ